MPWFMTEYQASWSEQPRGDMQPGNFGGNLWARNRRQAVAIAKQRGLKEAVIAPMGEKMPYFPAHRMVERYLQDKSPRKFRDAVHALCYLGMLAQASGVASAAQVVGDKGIVHDFVHDRRDSFTSSIESLLVRIKAIEAMVPGYLAKRR